MTIDTYHFLALRMLAEQEEEEQASRQPERTHRARRLQC